MNNQLHTITQHLENGIILEICYGKIPDKFRQLNFGPITELELPDTKGTDSKFQKWLAFYRTVRSPWVETQILEVAKCN